MKLMGKFDDVPQSRLQLNFDFLRKPVAMSRYTIRRWNTLATERSHYLVEKTSTSLNHSHGLDVRRHNTKGQERIYMNVISNLVVRLNGQGNAQEEQTLPKHRKRV